MARVGKKSQSYRLAGRRPAGRRQSSMSGVGAAPGTGVGRLGLEASEGEAAVAPESAPPQPEKVRKKRKKKKKRSAWAGLASGIGTASTLITSLAATAALLFTGLSLQQTREQNTLAESGQITDRFNAAVTNLGSGNETIRIGGIYALQRIMQDSPRDQPAAIQVLAAFIREEAPYKGTTPTPAAQAPAPAIDVQTALTVLATRNPGADGGTQVDLDATNLSGANLTQANFAGVQLANANLTDANLNYADFNDANLFHTNFTGVEFMLVNLTGAFLDDANSRARSSTVRTSRRRTSTR